MQNFKVGHPDKTGIGAGQKNDQVGQIWHWRKVEKYKVDKTGISAGYKNLTTQIGSKHTYRNKDRVVRYQYEILVLCEMA